MKKLCLGLSLLLAPLGARAAATCAYPSLCEGTKTYACAGPRVSGTVRIRSLGFRPDFGRIRYSSVANLKIDGVARTLKLNDHLQDFGRTYLDRWGTWTWNETQWIYALGGANLGLDPLKRGFHLEVNHGGQGEVVGYLGHRDHSFPADSSLSFRCR
jgi:hypothetical protein